MKIQLNKQKLKNLTKDRKVLPGDLTPKVAGGWGVQEGGSHGKAYCPMSAKGDNGEGGPHGC